MHERERPRLQFRLVILPSRPGEADVQTSDHMRVPLDRRLARIDRRLALAPGASRHLLRSVPRGLALAPHPISGAQPRFLKQFGRLPICGVQPCIEGEVKIRHFLSGRVPHAHLCQLVLDAPIVGVTWPEEDARRHGALQALEQQRQRAGLQAAVGIEAARQVGHLCELIPELSVEESLTRTPHGDAVGAEGILGSGLQHQRKFLTRGQDHIDELELAR
mmetsp:Transcript_115174/g.366001  ORF Transcript_115174/g.366001 Transcript_115174/m.366001 type:complete len:219 (-) Transcript_115174:121-777(-)